MALTREDKIIYLCNTKKEYDSLMKYLEKEGVKWIGCQEYPTERDYYYWRSDLAYFLKNLRLTWGFRSSVNDDNKGIQSFKVVHWKDHLESKLKNQPGLAEFLGWKDGTIYRDGVCFYKIKEEKLYTRNKHDKEWKIDMDFPLNEYSRLRELRVYEPKCMIKSQFQSDEGFQYLSKRGRSVFFAAKLKDPSIQIFTKEEAYDLISKYDLENTTEVIDVEIFE